MRFDLAFLAFTLFTTATASAIDPSRHVVRMDVGSQSEEHDLFKRKGGGGGSRGGGGGSRGSGSKSGGKSGGSGGVGGSGSPGSNSGNKAPTSIAGGTSRGGSGPRPAYGGYYGGGGSTPYTSGKKSPVGLIAPLALGGAALAFWPGLWLGGAYLYHYHNPYYYRNHTNNKDEEREVICGCAKESVCGCDENNNTDYITSLIGNGSYAALNKTLVNVAEVNGSMTLLINGTLPKGTTADGPDSAGATIQALGLWPAATAVLAIVFLA